MVFACQLVGLPMLPINSLQYKFSSALSPYIDIGSLCSFKAKVIRVLFQLE